MINLEIARKIIEDLQQNHHNLSDEAIDVALEQLAEALKEQPETLQINVSDHIDMNSILG